MERTITMFLTSTREIDMLDFKNERYLIEDDLVIHYTIPILKKYPCGVRYDNGIVTTTDDIKIDKDDPEYIHMEQICNSLYAHELYDDEDREDITCRVSMSDSVTVLVEWDLSRDEPIEEDDSDIYMESCTYNLDPSDSRYHLDHPYDYDVSLIKIIIPWFLEGCEYDIHTSILRDMSPRYHSMVKDIQDADIIFFIDRHVDMLQIRICRLCHVLGVTSFTLLREDDSTYKFICDKGSISIQYDQGADHV